MVDLNFSENGIGDVDVSGVCNVMMVLQNTLEKLHLNDNGITGKGAHELGQALGHMRTIKVLRLNSNPIGTLGAEAVLHVSAFYI